MTEDNCPECGYKIQYRFKKGSELISEFLEKLKELDTWSTGGEWDCYKQIDELIKEYEEKLQ